MFDVIVGNPPYQETHNLEQSGESNVSNVFHYFQNIADSISTMNSLIYPGERWILKIGRYMNDFGYSQLNSSSLQKVILYPDSRKVFQGAWVSGGVSIVFKDVQTNNNGKWTLQREDNHQMNTGIVVFPGEKRISTYPLLNNVIEKFDNLPWTRYLSDDIRTQKFFRVLSDAVEKNPDNFVRCNDTFTNQPEGFDIRVLTNDKAGKTGKATWFWTSRETIKSKLKEIDQWKIIMSSANLTGQNGRTPNTEIIPPNTAVGRVRLVISAFDTEQEAINCFNFLKTDIIRSLLTTTGNYITGFGSNVKMPESFLKDEILDFSEQESSLNEQLSKALHLTDEEKIAIKQISSSLSAFSSNE